MDPKSIPAFPHDADAAFNERTGMTLRDHFAGLALQAIIAADGTYQWDARARDAYAAADAMLEAR